MVNETLIMKNSGVDKPIKNYAIYIRLIVDNLFLKDSQQVNNPHLPIAPTTARFHINRIN